MFESYVGRVIKDRYRIIRKISRDADEYYFVGEDVLMGKTLGIRVIPYRFDDAESIRDLETMFQNQIDVLCRLDHPGLPQVIDGFTEKHEMFIITEFSDGETFEDKITRGDSFSQENLIQWSIEILKILVYLHSRYPPVIFRDLKPSNILMKKNGKIQLINFGMARTYKPFKTQDTLIRGSKGYAAPEQYGGKGQTDARADIYSFGATLHRLLTGYDPSRSPFQLPPLANFREEIAQGWQDIISRATDLKAENRYKTAKEIIKALEGFGGEKPEAVRETGEEGEPGIERQNLDVSPPPEKVKDKDENIGEKKRSLQTMVEDHNRVRGQNRMLLTRLISIICIILTVSLLGIFTYKVLKQPVIAFILIALYALISGTGAYFFLFRK